MIIITQKTQIPTPLCLNMEKNDLLLKTCSCNVNKYIRLDATLSFQFMDAILNVPYQENP